MEWLEPWRTSLKNYSQQIYGVIALLPFAFMALPTSWQEVITEQRWPILVFSGLSMLGFILRNIKQANKNVANADRKVFENDG